MMLQRPPNPVEHGFNGETFNVRQLGLFCNAMTANMTSIEADFANVRALIAQEKKLNNQLVDFATWVIAQHPNALHEYKSVATTLTALEGRDNEGAHVAQSSP